jgi:hypothetical protein
VALYVISAWQEYETGVYPVWWDASVGAWVLLERDGTMWDSADEAKRVASGFDAVGVAVRVNRSRYRTRPKVVYRGVDPKSGAPIKAPKPRATAWKRILRGFGV